MTTITFAYCGSNGCHSFLDDLEGGQSRLPKEQRPARRRRILSGDEEEKRSVGFVPVVQRREDDRLLQKQLQRGQVGVFIERAAQWCRNLQLQVASY